MRYEWDEWFEKLERRYSKPKTGETLFALGRIGSGDRIECQKWEILHAVPVGVGLRFKLSYVSKGVEKEAEWPSLDIILYRPRSEYANQIFNHADEIAKEVNEIGGNMLMFRELCETRARNWLKNGETS